MFAEVIVDISAGDVDRIFDYDAGSLPVLVGSRVLVPFGNRAVEGYCLGLKESSDVPPEKIKAVKSVVDPYPVIGGELMALARYMTGKYHLKTVDALRLFIPPHMRGGRVKELERLYASISPEYAGRDPDGFIRPSAQAQRDVYFYIAEAGEAPVSEINNNLSASALRNLTARGIVKILPQTVMRKPYKDMAEGPAAPVPTRAQAEVTEAVLKERHSVFLLHGVTGSGKTEVYVSCIADALSRGKSAIMLVPEISLTPQFLRYFRSRFGNGVAILHSALGAGERFDEWRRLLSGEARVALGPRSAVFAPVKDVGVIIIDEEHDSSYISESNPRYSTFEVARFRADFNGCNLILGSATPSVESYYRASTGEFRLLELKERINKRDLPKIQIVDMCKELYDGNDGVFSRALERGLRECADGGNQAILFINRRGYSSFLMCRSCGYVAKCADCDVSLVYHRDENVLKCHYCSNRYGVPDVCPECKSPALRRGYAGTERVAERLAEIFPDKKILRLDNDTTRTKESHAKILGEFADKKATFLVGTQMVAKGHDFPSVTLVGIIDADMSLHFSDYRSFERTYQLITQVGGRAGRAENPGKVILQTYAPRHYVYKFAVNNDYKGFFDKECNLREVTKYPPFSQIVRVLVSGEREDSASGVLKNIFNEVGKIQKAAPEAFAYYAAMRAPLGRIQNKFRLQLIARITKNFDEICPQIYAAVDKYSERGVSAFVEINPSNMS
ncbi:MAG: primosomal protein N' [Clostridiales bacterium]|jgi:primosomal protein N' (replication factor Y)|nr:primosomal protein N' [Clostridiales bacterium]